MTPGTPSSGARRSGRGSLASLGSSGGSGSAAAAAAEKQQPPASPYIRSLSNTTPLSPGGRSLMGGQGGDGQFLASSKSF